MLELKKEVCIFVFFVFFLQIVSSAHYITGYVENALDGESANDKIVTIWNYANGQNENMTDIVGINGNAAYPNVWMIDCDLFASGCFAGDIFSAKIFGETYISDTVNITISLAGYDSADNLTLNSPPTAFLNFPEDNVNVSANIDFNCSYNDHDDNIARVSLWGNWTGGWQEIESRNLGPNSGIEIFSKTLTQGNYLWNCLVEDDFGISDFSFNNNSFFVDATNPVITSVDLVSLNICGFGIIPVNCSAYDDDLEIDSVIIESISPNNSKTNYSASLVLTNIYSANILVDSIGNWSFNCFANDSVGNVNNLTSSFVEVLSGNTELVIIGETVNFDKSPSLENEIINVSVDIENIGCSDGNNFIVGFFDGNKTNGSNFDNKTISIGAKSSLNIYSLFPAKIGISNIFVYADLINSIFEDNESNNEANNSIYLKSWQIIFGNLTLDKTLRGKDANMSFWAGESSFNGNIFIADKESQIEWTNLQAIGRTKTNEISLNDFSEIDNFLGMSQYNDSIYDLFTNLGTPKYLDNFNIFKRNVNNVAIINSSSNGNFQTGILWDMSDSVNSEYDSFEGEDIIFVTRINRGAIGEFGIYDYEINIPAKLRSYNSAEESEVYLYYDLN